MAEITPDAGSVAAGGVLDSLLGTAGSAVDLWNKWQSGKVETLQAKAAIPTTATPTGAAAAPSSLSLSPNVLLVGVVAAVGLLVVFMLGGRGGKS